MKKLMIATAALCAAVGASALESANVVGYQEVSLVAGAKAISSGFLEIGTNGVNLTSIVPKGYGDKCNGTINIQRLAADGTTADMWKWYDGQTAGKFKGKTGWFIGSSTTQVTSENDVTFVSGEGLWVTGLDGASITFSGEVPKGNFSFLLVAGAKMIGNPYPASFNLSAVTPSGYGDKCNGTINIQRLAADGTTADMWKWYDGQTAGKFKGKTGWFIGSSTTQVTSESDVTIAAGEALWVTGNGGETLTIPAPASIAAE